MLCWIIRQLVAGCTSGGSQQATALCGAQAGRAKASCLRRCVHACAWNDVKSRPANPTIIVSARKEQISVPSARGQSTSLPHFFTCVFDTAGKCHNM